MKAIWKQVILAESDETIAFEGERYFPAESLNERYFRPSTSNTVSPRLGVARYFTIVVEGEKLVDAAWSYANPSAPAETIAGYVAFGQGVEVAP